jgi:hypothetical protein
MRKISERLIRSILYRRRLLENLAALELKAIEAVNEADHDFLVTPSYVIRADPAGLDITERDPIDADQLELPLQHAE